MESWRDRLGGFMPRALVAIHDLAMVWLCWQALHRCVYAVAGLAILHFFWMRAGKNDFGEVAVYALILTGLLGWRVAHALRKGRGARSPVGAAAVSTQRSAKP